MLKKCVYLKLCCIKPDGRDKKMKLATRTHSMARHRKSPRSRRNLMVIDTLTPSQGHQFDRRLKIFSVSWSTAHPRYFDMTHDHVQKIKFLTPPQGPRGQGPKKLCGCMCHSCE